MYALIQPELLTVLTAAEELLAATGNAVDLCPVYGERAVGGGRASAGRVRS